MQHHQLLDAVLDREVDIAEKVDVGIDPRHAHASCPLDDRGIDQVEVAARQSDREAIERIAHLAEHQALRLDEVESAFPSGGDPHGIVRFPVAVDRDDNPDLVVAELVRHLTSEKRQICLHEEPMTDARIGLFAVVDALRHELPVDQRFGRAEVDLAFGQTARSDDGHVLVDCPHGDVPGHKAFGSGVPRALHGDGMDAVSAAEVAHLGNTQVEPAKRTTRLQRLGVLGNPVCQHLPFVHGPVHHKVAVHESLQLAFAQGLRSQDVLGSLRPVDE